MIFGCSKILLKLILLQLVLSGVQLAPIENESLSTRIFNLGEIAKDILSTGSGEVTKKVDGFTDKLFGLADVLSSRGILPQATIDALDKKWVKLDKILKENGESKGLAILGQKKFSWEQWDQVMTSLERNLKNQTGLSLDSLVESNRTEGRLFEPSVIKVAAEVLLKQVQVINSVLEENDLPTLDDFGVPEMSKESIYVKLTELETSIKKFSGMELADELDLSDEENSDWDYDGVLARKLTNFEVPANLLEKVARLNEFLMTKGIKSLKISELNEEKIREKLDGLSQMILNETGLTLDTLTNMLNLGKAIRKEMTGRSLLTEVTLAKFDQLDMLMTSNGQPSLKSVPGLMKFNEKRMNIFLESLEQKLFEETGLSLDRSKMQGTGRSLGMPSFDIEIKLSNLTTELFQNKTSTLGDLVDLMRFSQTSSDNLMTIRETVLKSENLTHTTVTSLVNCIDRSIESLNLFDSRLSNYSNTEEFVKTEAYERFKLIMIDFPEFISKFTGIKWSENEATEFTRRFSILNDELFDSLKNMVSKSSTSLEIAAPNETELGIDVMNLIKELTLLEESKNVFNSAEKVTKITKLIEELSRFNETIADRERTLNLIHELSTFGKVVGNSENVDRMIIELSKILGLDKTKMNATLEDVPMVNTTMEAVSNMNGTLEDLSLSNPTSEVFPIIHSKQEKLPMLNVTQEEFPIMDGKLEKLPMLNVTQEEFPIMDGKLESLPLLNVTQEEFPIMDGKLEKLTVLNVTVETLPMLNVTQEEFPIMDGKLESLPFLNFTQEILPLLNVTQEELPIMDGKLESLPFLNVTQEALPILNVTLKTLPMLNVTQEEFPIMDGKLEKLTVLNVTVETLPILNVTLETLPILNVTEETLPKMNFTQETLPILNVTLETLPMLNVTVEELPIMDGKLEFLPFLNVTLESSPKFNVTLESLPFLNSTQKSVTVLNTTLESMTVLETTTLTINETVNSVQMDNSSFETDSITNNTWEATTFTYSTIENSTLETTTLGSISPETTTLEFDLTTTSTEALPSFELETTTKPFDESNIHFEIKNYTVISHDSSVPNSYSLRIRIKGYKWNNNFSDVQSIESQKLLKEKILPLLYKNLNLVPDEINEVKLLRLFKGKRSDSESLNMPQNTTWYMMERTQKKDDFVFNFKIDETNSTVENSTSLPVKFRLSYPFEIAAIAGSFDFTFMNNTIEQILKQAILKYYDGKLEHVLVKTVQSTDTNKFPIKVSVVFESNVAISELDVSESIIGFSVNKELCKLDSKNGSVVCYEDEVKGSDSLLRLVDVWLRLVTGLTKTNRLLNLSQLFEFNSAWVFGLIIIACILALFFFGCIFAICYTRKPHRKPSKVYDMESAVYNKISQHKPSMYPTTQTHVIPKHKEVYY